MELSGLGAGLERMQAKWGWIVALGILMVVAGTVALLDTVTATVVSVMLLGWMLLLSSAFHLVKAFHARGWHGLFLDLLGFVLDLVLGLILLFDPAAGAITLTLVLAAFFLAGGLIRLFGAFSFDVPHKGWAALDGIVTAVLGVLLWIHWPSSGLWFIGFAVGIVLIFRGWSWLMLGMTLRGRGAKAAA